MVEVLGSGFRVWEASARLMEGLIRVCVVFLWILVKSPCLMLLRSVLRAPVVVYLLFLSIKVSLGQYCSGVLRLCRAVCEYEWFCLRR